MTHIQNKRQTIKTAFGQPDVGLSDKDFKTAILNKFQELKETIFKELKKYMIIMTHQIENIK